MGVDGDGVKAGAEVAPSSHVTRLIQSLQSRWGLFPLQGCASSSIATSRRDPTESGLINPSLIPFFTPSTPTNVANSRNRYSHSANYCATRTLTSGNAKYSSLLKAAPAMAPRGAPAPREPSIERTEEYDKFIETLRAYHEKRGCVWSACNRAKE